MRRGCGGEGVVLGLVCWMGEVVGPHQDGGEVEAAEVVEGGLVVAGGDATPVLDAVEGPLDYVAVVFRV